jgi:hypothetical protein
MKKITHLILFIFLLISCSNNNRIIVKSDLETLRLKGKIKKIEKSAWEVEMSFGELKKIKPVIGPSIEPVGFYEDYFRELHFNKNGNITRRVWLDENDLIVSTENYYYDKYNRFIKYVTEKNNTLTTTYNDIDFTTNTHKKYLNNGSLSFEERYISFYDENSNIIKVDYYDKEKFTGREFLNYNSNGRLESKKQYMNWRGGNTKGKITGYKLFGYDFDGNLVSSLDSISSYKNIETSLDIYTYNEQDDVISQYCPREKFSLINPTYSYKYDKNNNWIERIEYVLHGKYKRPRQLTIRKIEYY